MFPHVECLASPKAYSQEQLRRALNIAAALRRGRLVLVEPPVRCTLCFGTIGVFCTRCGRH